MYVHFLMAQILSLGIWRLMWSGARHHIIVSIYCQQPGTQVQVPYDDKRKSKNKKQ